MRKVSGKGHTAYEWTTKKLFDKHKFLWFCGNCYVRYHFALNPISNMSKDIECNEKNIEEEQQLDGHKKAQKNDFRAYAMCVTYVCMCVCVCMWGVESTNKWLMGMIFS